MKRKPHEVVAAPHCHHSFMQGIGVVIGALIRDRDLPSVAVDILRCNGLKLSDFEGCGVEDFDLRHIRKACKESQ
jgi:hypothetical protein